MELFTNLLSCLGLVFFIIIPEVSGEYCTYYSGSYEKSKYCSGGCCGSSYSTAFCTYYSSSYGSVRLISGIISSLVFLIFIGLFVYCYRRRRNPTTVMRAANPTMAYSKMLLRCYNMHHPPTYDSPVFARPQGKDNAAYDRNNLNKT